MSMEKSHICGIFIEAAAAARDEPLLKKQGLARVEGNMPYFGNDRCLNHNFRLVKLYGIAMNRGRKKQFIRDAK